MNPERTPKEWYPGGNRGEYSKFFKRNLAELIKRIPYSRNISE